MIFSAYSPRLYPDEHILSAVSRLARLMGEKHLDTAFVDMKDDNNNFLPGVVLRPWYHHIASLFPAMDIDELISRHTLWRYYKPFMSPALSSVPNPDTWPNYYNKRSHWLPIRQVRIRHAQYWRWCTDCAESDADSFGIPYWHCSHQIPAITHCKKHNRQLVGFCLNCGFSVSKLLPHLRPSTSPECPKCGQLFDESIPEDKYGLVKWLSDTSSAIFNGCNTFDWERHRLKIITNHDLKLLNSSSSVSGRKHYACKRKLLETGLEKDVIEWLFTLPRNHQSSQTNSAIDLKILLSDQLFPPLSYLIVMWVLHTQAETHRVAS